jgi:hypothetical protein
MKRYLFLLTALFVYAHGAQTLLGADTDRNGIRDDVDRWITAHAKHPIERALFAQAARALQRQIALYGQVGDHAVKLVAFKKKYLDAYAACEFYWTYESPASRYRVPEGEGYFTEKLEKIQFDTPERRKAFDTLEHILEQRSCPLVEPDRSRCDFDSDALMPQGKR